MSRLKSQSDWLSQSVLSSTYNVLSNAERDILSCWLNEFSKKNSWNLFNEKANEGARR